jgi:hypothetical protein
VKTNDRSDVHLPKANTKSSCLIGFCLFFFSQFFSFFQIAFLGVSSQLARGVQKYEEKNLEKVNAGASKNKYDMAAYPVPFLPPKQERNNHNHHWPPRQDRQGPPFFWRAPYRACLLLPALFYCQ